MRTPTAVPTTLSQSTSVHCSQPVAELERVARAAAVLTLRPAAKRSGCPNLREISRIASSGSASPVLHALACTGPWLHYASGFLHSRKLGNTRAAEKDGVRAGTPRTHVSRRRLSASSSVLLLNSNVPLTPWSQVSLQLSADAARCSAHDPGRGGVPAARSTSTAALTSWRTASLLFFNSAKTVRAPSRALWCE